MSVLALAMFGGGMAILLVGMFVLSEEAARTAQVWLQLRQLGCTGGANNCCGCNQWPCMKLPSTLLYRSTLATPIW